MHILNAMKHNCVIRTRYNSNLGSSSRRMFIVTSIMVRRINIIIINEIILIHSPNAILAILLNLGLKAITKSPLKSRDMKILNLKTNTRHIFSLDY